LNNTASSVTIPPAWPVSCSKNFFQVRDINLANLKWNDDLNAKNANIFGVKNAPEGFIAYALKRGAIQKESDNP